MSCEYDREGDERRLGNGGGADGFHEEQHHDMDIIGIFSALCLELLGVLERKT